MMSDAGSDGANVFLRGLSVNQLLLESFKPGFRYTGLYYTITDIVGAVVMRRLATQVAVFVYVVCGVVAGIGTKTVSNVSGLDHLISGATSIPQSQVSYGDDGTVQINI